MNRTALQKKSIRLLPVIVISLNVQPKEHIYNHLITMTLHARSLFIRGSVNPGFLAGSAVAATEKNEKNKNLSTRGRIIGEVTRAVLLAVIAVCYDRRKKLKARHGSLLRDTGAGEDEAVPMVYRPVGMQIRSIVQPDRAYFPPQGEGMNAGSGYAEGPMHMTAGQQGTQFYRNQ